MRTKKLSNDKTPLFEVYKYVVKEYKKIGFVFDEIWSIMPCAPNLNAKDLKKISIFYKKLKIKNHYYQFQNIKCQ